MSENLLPLHCEGSLASPTCAEFWWELEQGWTLLSVLEFLSILTGMSLPQATGEHFCGDRTGTGTVVVLSRCHERAWRAARCHQR